MTTRHLLFVDDLPSQRMLFKDAVSDWNDKNPEQTFTQQSVESYEEALEVLKRIRFDGALFDLRLPTNGKGKHERPLGNDLAERGLHQYGIPVAIISAKPDEIDPEFQGSTTVRIINKGDGGGFDDAIAWFGAQWAMLEALSSARSKIREVSAGLFAERIWPGWKSYLAIGHDEGLTPVLARQFIWHLGEVMGTSGETSDLWHPLEAWICPPLHEERAATGDVVDRDGELWIVLTPPCDLANAGKVESILLANCSRDIPEEWQQWVEDCYHEAEGKRTKALRKLAKLFNQVAPSQHYLPPLPGETRPVVVQFTTLKTIPVNEFEEWLPSRIGSVTAPFINNLIQRFGAHLSRVGQPNLDVSLFGQKTGQDS
jgi:CheY-like chemotaxis protein